MFPLNIVISNNKNILMKNQPVDLQPLSAINLAKICSMFVIGQILGLFLDSLITGVAKSFGVEDWNYFNDVSVMVMGLIMAGVIMTRLPQTSRVDSLEKFYRSYFFVGLPFFALGFGTQFMPLHGNYTLAQTAFFHFK